MHTFRVTCSTRPGEHLAVTGSTPQLGGWSKHGILILEHKPNSDVWEKSVDLGSGEHFYRYCVVVLLQQGRVVVRRWETHQHPRRVASTAMDASEDVVSVQEDVVSVQEDVFGRVSGQVGVQRGWLTEEMLVQFKLSHAAVNIWKRKYAGHRLWIKITPVDQGRGPSSVDHEDNTESLDVAELRLRAKNFPIVETACLSEAGCLREVQAQFGVEVNDTFTLVEVQLTTLHNVAFLVDIYGLAENRREDDIPEHVGMCYINSDTLRETGGRIETTITSMKYQPIGRLLADYLLIRPVEGLDCDFSKSPRSLWSGDYGGLDVGHRGLGNSYTTAQTCSNVRENTIASLKDAVLHGADMVEFDVQVSADLVPVIYHEFTLCVQTKTKHNGEIMLDVPVKDLTLAQLQGLKVHHPSEKSAGVKTFPEAETGDTNHEPFPTLETALCHVDEDCGFNIEIKFSQLFKDGREEQKQMMEMNLFLDQVLKTVFSHGKDRKIVFSSFAPDVCTMLVNKQNRYPVLLLTSGTNNKYEEYLDPRTKTIPDAIWFGNMVGLFGISAMAEGVISEPSLVQKVKDNGQVLFCWTDDRNDRETVQYLKSLGIHGIIYDRMDQNNSKQVKESVFLQERRKGKSDSGISTDSSPISSPAAANIQL